jgi:FkbM family methyltransferase
MTLPSAVRYRNFLARQDGAERSGNRLLKLTMKSPFRGDIWLREAGSDEDTFKEIVQKRVYDDLLGLHDCKYVMDLGANVGVATRLFASAYPAAKIFAVEPDAENLTVLNRNVSALARAARCNVCRAAVWDRDGTLSLTPPPRGIEYNAIRATEGDGGPGANVVDGFSMDSLVRRSGFPQIDLLKVDVEGAESRMFQGNLHWLDRVGMIAIEFHGDSRHESGFDAAMKAHKFIVADSNPHTVVAHRA